MSWSSPPFFKKVGKGHQPNKHQSTQAHKTSHIHSHQHKITMDTRKTYTPVHGSLLCLGAGPLNCVLRGRRAMFARRRLPSEFSEE